MSKNYDLIATVDIDLTTPIVEDSTFDNLLIVGPLPKVAPEVAPAKVGVYESLKEVEEAGWVTSGENADPVGAAARIAFMQSPVPDNIYIAPIQTAAPAEEGGEAVAEKAVDTVKRAAGTTGWYVVCPVGVASSEYQEIAEFIEGQTKMFCYTETECFDKGGDELVCIPAVSSEYFRTCGIFTKHSASTSESGVSDVNQYINVAYMVKWLSYQSGSETAAFKALVGVEPSDLTSDEVDALVEKNLNYFVNIGSSNVTVNGKVLAGEWMDVIRFRDWLKNDMQVREVKLFVSNPKIPYTDAGIALIQNMMLASLKAGQDIGGIAPDEYDADGNLITAYVTSVPTSASITATQKATRKLTGCTFKARLAGAIHFAEIKGSLTYEM